LFDEVSNPQAAGVVDLGFLGGHAYESCSLEGFTLFMGKLLDFLPEA
jgi:hypothetical protein